MKHTALSFAIYKHNHMIMNYLPFLQILRYLFILEIILFITLIYFP